MYVHYVFFRLPSCRDPHRDGSLCIVLSPTCLGIFWTGVLIVSPQDTAIVTSLQTRQAFTDPTRHALSCPHPSSPRSSSLPLLVLSLSLLHGVDSAFWMLATNILKVFVWFVTFYCRRSPRDKCKLIFHLKHWHSIFIGCESQLKVIVFNGSSPVMGVYLSFQAVWHLDAGKFSGR